MSADTLQFDIITNPMLLEKYLPLPMEKYFHKKLKNESQEYIKLKICELLKFLSMSHHVYGDIPFNDEIDEMWHLWILQTIQYQDLIQQLPTKTFINHCSNDYHDDSIEPNESAQEKINQQISYLMSYVINFGDFTQETIQFWPMTVKLMEIMKFDVIELNQYLKTFIIAVTDG